MTEFTNEDAKYWLIIGISCFIFGWIIFSGTIFFDADDGEVSLNGERFVRVDAEQKVEEFGCLTSLDLKGNENITDEGWENLPNIEEVFD